MPNPIQTPNLRLPESKINLNITIKRRKKEKKKEGFKTLDRDWGGTTGVVQ